MWHGAGVRGGQPGENPPISSLTAKGTRPWSRASSPAMTTSLLSRPPVPGGALGCHRLHRHHLVQKVCTFGFPGFAGQGDVCPEFGETEAETADKVCPELCKKPRVKYTNNLPQLPPIQGSSCLQLLEELICAGSYPGRRKAQSLGASHAFHTPSCPGGCSRDLGLSVPGQGGFRGPTATSQPRTCLCSKMNCSVSLGGTQLLHIPACCAGSTRGREGDALLPNPSPLASLPLLKVHVSRWSQK